ncbi:chemotaxis protein CheW [Variovorax sp. LT1R16]|uniref:chemotaxis protein CheW n=1 Tax=Variovorax sp. LT1R16 TaxID=3443728 RepID=UPI003F4865D3
MANRDALRAFQSRLAARLQAARTSDVSASWLAVEAGEGRYLLPLGHAGEIFPWTPPQAVPYTEPWFLGVANLRGGLYGVVQLSSFATGHAQEPPAATVEGARAQSRLVALNELLEVNCALLVDRLVGLRGVEAFAASQRPADDAPAWFGHSYTDAEGASWQEISLQALSQHPRFLSIGA